MATTLAPGRIARPRLARRLCAAFDAGSALLLAGAGYGKTMALEEAIAGEGRRAVWIYCGEARGEAGLLLMSVVQGLRSAVPGLVDVEGDRMTAGVQRLDVGIVTGVLLGELERLLVEPLVIVFDDAEELEDSPDALALLDRLLAVRGAPLSLAIATRRPLKLRLAKLRAAGRLLELGASELSFTSSECEEILRLRHGRAVSDEEVEATVAATEGWPMGVALTGLTQFGGTATGSVPQAELFHYLAEEVLDRLDPSTRLALVDSSVPDTLTPELARDLGLPADFLSDMERSGVFLRKHATGVSSYHPLFRTFLREHLAELRSDDERAALHERAAASLAESGRKSAAIGHWLEAGRFQEALAAMSVYGPELLRTSPGTVEGWLSRLPPQLHDEPDYLFLQGQRVASAGRHDQALGPLRAAVTAYRAAGNTDREWVTRMLLADSLTLVGKPAEIAPLAEGWEEVADGAAAVAAKAVAWYQVTGLTSLGQTDEAEALRTRLMRYPEAAEQSKLLDALSRAMTAFADGRVDEALETLHHAIDELELDDPRARQPYAVGMVLVMLRNLGERDAAWEWLDRCEQASERAGLGFALRDFRLQRASMLAQRGELSAAEVLLGSSAGGRSGSGWRGVYEASAEAHVCLLRGDSAAAVAAADRAIECGRLGPMPWRVLATVEMADILLAAGSPGAARGALAATLAAVDGRLPGERGRFFRSALLAARASLEYKTGEPDAANRSMSDAWDEAGDQVGRIVRAHWSAVKPVLWQALAQGDLTPETALAAMYDAFPGGEALVAMIDHPDPTVRRAALLAALGAGHPAVLAQLEPLGKDADEQVAAAAIATRERLRGQPPPLRFELLGGFRVRRAGWELDEGVWQRPMAARVVRFLLIQDSNVPEDALFEAFWPDRDADAARQHLAVAISRARKVLDLPDTEQSVIEAKERTYRLRLRDRDSMDADEFERAAAAALADRGRDRTATLEASAALWTGEPLPEDRYAAWSLPWRERLAQTYAHVLTALVESHAASGSHHDAIRVAGRLLELDPLDERAHRELMVGYSRTGRTSQALRQFLECRRSMITVLGVEPSAETSGIQARILAGEPV